MALIEQLVTLRLKDHYGIPTQAPSMHSSQHSKAQQSLKAYKSLSGQLVKGTTAKQPTIVETSSEKEDDASMITAQSKTQKREAKTVALVT